MRMTFGEDAGMTTINTGVMDAVGVLVHRVADGLWGEVLHAKGNKSVCEYNFWVDFRLALASEPEAVGVIWTDNGGANWHVVAAAKYTDLPNGESMWGVSVKPCGDAWLDRRKGLVSWYPVGSTHAFRPRNGRVQVQYAIFCRVDGICHWDNNQGRNYGFHIGEEAAR
jgi:hypothetical protein